MRKLVTDSTIRVCRSDVKIREKIAARYPRLGKGEIESLSYVTEHTKSENPFMFFSDDRQACKVAKELGIETASMLDFVQKVYDLQIMSAEEIRIFVLELPNHMWLTRDLVARFLQKIDKGKT